MSYFEIWRKIADRSIASRDPILCDKWRHYRGWLEDVEQLPGASPTATLRRYDASRLYEPGNVRWVPRGNPGVPRGTPRTPRKNQVFHLTYNGQRITQKEAAALLSTTHGAFWQRMHYRNQRDGQTHFDLNEFLWN